MEPAQNLLTLRKKEPARGFALFAMGFRPFFLLAALHAVVMIPLWIVVHTGAASIDGYFLPSSWHAHEMVFGYTSAVIAGFLLTAASNWTKRTTATGGLLALLCVVWLLGRIAPLFATVLPPIAVATISSAFLPLLAVALARAIIPARSRRNYGILVVVVALWLAQLMTHWGVLDDDVLWQVTGPKVGVDLIVVLILVIGGRIIPLFTRNATRVEGIRSLALLDRSAIIAAMVVACADAALLHGPALTGLVGFAAVSSAARTWRWGFSATRGNPLLWVLHVGYFFVPCGFALRAGAMITPTITTSTALHLMTAGAIGVLTLGMMVRVALGHTGRPLVSSKAHTAAFALVIVAALVRVGGALGGSTASLHASATLWAVAFAIYLGSLGSVLIRPRLAK